MFEAESPRRPGANAQRLRGEAPRRRHGLWHPSRWAALPVLLGAGLALLVLLAVAAVLYDQSRANTIANGVRVGGVDIGGLSVSAARQRLQQDLAAPLERTLVVRVGHEHFPISAQQAHVAVAVDALTQQALRDSRGGWILGRVIDGLTGRSLNVNLSPEVGFSTDAVRRFALSVAARTHRPARDASVQPSASGLRKVGSREGVEVYTGALIGQIDQALQHPGTPRVIVPPLKRLRPKVTLANLSSHYPAYIVINRSAFQLRFYRHLRLVHTYTIAVGMQGLETPAGLYSIQDKEVNPSWHVPNSSWAGSLAGQTIPPGPQDPIKARWMGVANGAGIHGTDETSSLGTAGSHGCIRMSIPDVIQLYSQVPLHTPVYIA